MARVETLSQFCQGVDEGFDQGAECPGVNSEKDIVVKMYCVARLTEDEDQDASSSENRATVCRGHGWGSRSESFQSETTLWKTKPHHVERKKGCEKLFILFLPVFVRFGHEQKPCEVAICGTYGPSLLSRTRRARCHGNGAW